MTFDEFLSVILFIAGIGLAAFVIIALSLQIIP
jgi:hypothetical protein